MLRYSIFIFLLLPPKLFAHKLSQANDCIPAITITGNKNNVCLGTSISFHAGVLNGGTNGTYKWKKNNLDAGAGNDPNYKASDFHDNDVVTCAYSCKTSCGTDTTITSNSIKLKVPNDITPLITISNSDSLICEGVPTLFKAVASYGSAIPFYQWSVNGIPAGSNQPDYITDSITNGSLVKCILTITTAACPDTSMSTSSQLNIYVYPMIHPAIKITPNRTEICRGETVTFTATANGGSYPSFAWEINGLPTGDISRSLTTGSLKDGDSVSCTITIDQDSRCHTTTSARSNKVGIHVKDYEDPEVSIASPRLDVCTGDSITFIARGVNIGASASYEWIVNKHFSGSSSSTFTSNQLKNGDSVFCVLIAGIPGCIITAVDSSNYEVVTVRDAPAITFSPPEVSILSGESALLKATVQGNLASFVWRPGSALLMPQSLETATIPLSHDTIFNLSALDIDGCKTNKDLHVKVLHKLFMPSAFTPNNDGKNDVFRIPHGASIILLDFSVFDRWGNIVFKTNDIEKGWDGTYQNKELDAGTYVYFIKGIFQDKETITKGTITLVR